MSLLVYCSFKLHDVFQKLGCKMLGYTSQDGYEHSASKSIRGDKFCGLLCDESELVQRFPIPFKIVV